MNAIDRLIDETPGISKVYQTFLKTVLHARKEKILDAAYHKLSAMNAASSFFN